MPEKTKSPLSATRRASLHKQLKYWSCESCETRNYNLGRDDCFRCKTNKPRTAGEVCAALQTLTTSKPAEKPESPKKTETPEKSTEGSTQKTKEPTKKTSTRQKSNSDRTVTPKKKSDMPTWECLSCKTKNFNLKRIDCLRCKAVRGAGEISHLDHGVAKGSDAPTMIGKPHVTQLPPAEYEGDWIPDYHEGQIVDALYKREEGDAGKWMSARIQGVNYRKRTYTINFGLSEQKKGIQELAANQVLGIGSEILVEAEGPWKGREGVVVGYRHSQDLWRIELADGRRKNVKLGGLIPQESAKTINPEAGAV